MKLKINHAAALASAAAVGLLAGPAFASGPDTMGAPIVCPTTQMFPGHNDCVMPTAKYPGGGSFPGSFLIPGTNTSFAVHGFIQVDFQHNLGPHTGDTTWGAQSIPLEGSTAHSLNGGTNMGVKPTRPNIEFTTPTAYGLLKTYVEFDFNEVSGSQIAGNADQFRLRQAYAALGPWLIGQSLSLYADVKAYADTATGIQDVGMLNTANVRRPQLRYTWLAGNGLSIAGSIEEPSYYGDIAATAAGGFLKLDGVSAYYNWPHFVGAAEWDQPWGHIRFAAAGGVYDYRSTGFNKSEGGYAFHLSGHLNTWGKDALRGGLWYNHGAADFDSWITQGSYAVSSDGTIQAQKAWAFYASYEHFFNGQWRANESFGFMPSVTGMPTGWTSAELTNLQKREFSNEVNVIFSPVPQTDFILEWQHAYRRVMSGADGSDDNIDFQLKAYF